MFDRLPLKTALLLGACITLPISQATGDNVNNYPAMGVVVPGGAQMAHVSAPAALQPAMPSFAPFSATAVAPALPPVVPANAPASPAVVPTMQAPAQVVLPAPMPEAVSPAATIAVQPAAPIIREVAPGENPFGPSTTTAVRRPASQPTAASTLRPAAPAASRDSVEMQIARLSEQTEEPKVASQSEVDETALRYYAQTRDLKRLGAELRRLKTLYPDWDAPEDLFDTPTNISEQPLWDIFGSGDFVRVRTEMAKLQSENPNWKPSQELLDKLALAETRKLMERSHAQRNWGQVVTLAEGSPQLMVCAEMNTMWITAEALAQSRDFVRAFDLYKYIVTTCEDPIERLSTVQKASLLLPEAGTRSLVALGNVLSDGSGEFDDVSFDLVRRKMGLIAQGNGPATALTMEELQRFSDYVQRSFSAADAELFGWFYYGQQSWEASYHWFVSATRMTTSPKSVEGVILTLRNLQHRDEALQLARQSATLTPELKKIYIELVSAGLTDQESPLSTDDSELKTFETYVFEQKSALGAQALAWHRLESKQTKEASRLFQQSVEWEATEGGVVGLAVLASRAKSWGRVAAIKKEYGAKFAALEDIKVYRPRTTQKRTTTTTKPKEKPNLLTWLMQKDKRDEKKARLEIE
ncbi:hypothetical protein [Rhizobium rhizophilum]|nr:hypothetical protein [Rhizobium rhizophilum]